MRITNDIRDFIAKKVDSKVAPVSITQDYEAVMSVVEDFEQDLTNRMQAVAKKEFEDFLELHPELAGSEFYSPLSAYRGRFRVIHSDVEICKAYSEQLKMRTAYVDEVVQRVCIDATSCKDTEELLALIDRIVR